MKPWDPPDPVRLGSGRRTHSPRAATVGSDELPLLAVADGLEAPVPVALRLRAAGLIDEHSPVQVITATPPPVRERVAGNRAAVSVTPPPQRRLHAPPRGVQPVLEDAE